MKNYFSIFILLVLTVLFSCDSVNKSIPKKGKFIQDLKNNDGTITQKEYSDGILKSEFVIKGNKRHGKGMVYYPSGKIHSKFNYVDGKLEGEAIWYYENGNVYDLKTYVHHLKQGMRKTYFEDGKLKSEQEYQNDMPQKGLKEYNSKSELISQPKLILTVKNKIVYENKYSILCSLSEKSGKVTYYKIIKYDDKSEASIQLNDKNKVGVLEYTLFPGNMIMEDILIRAETKTSFGNTLILEKPFRVAIQNR